MLEPKTKEERQRNTAKQRRCRCGNCAPWDDSLCAACRREHDDRQNLIRELYDCENMDELKSFIVYRVIPKLKD